jgi:hypothetical protein
MEIMIEILFWMSLVAAFLIGWFSTCLFLATRHRDDE